MYQLVASDMDETFLHHGSVIPPVNLQALRRMRELGVLFVPCSGRPYASIMGNFAEVDQDLMRGTYVISLNGGFIHRYGEDAPLTTCEIAPDTARAIYRTAVEGRYCVHVYLADGHVWVSKTTPTEDAYLANFPGIVHYDYDTEPDLPFEQGQPVAKILYMDYDFDALRRLRDKLKPKMDERGIDITFSSGRYIEFMPAGVDKGRGLRRLAELLDIPIEQTIGIGDAENDYALIRDAGLGVGVANVADDVRPVCDVVLKTAGPDGAFPELLERFIEPAAQAQA